jgi:hypothetical protein
MSERDQRKEFLIAMYNQLMNDINRHIIVVWQSIAALGAAIAVFGLVKDDFFSLDIAVTIVLIVCIWLLAHVYDASYWYNRNLVIIANIERQFLNADDLTNIHYYFGKHRPKGAMISHLRMQKGLGLAVAALVLVTHFFDVILANFDGGLILINFLPWTVALAGGVIWNAISKSSTEKYAEFIKNSPGIEIDASHVSYGKGHGFGNKIG